MLDAITLGMVIAHGAAKHTVKRAYERYTTAHGEAMPMV